MRPLATVIAALGVLFAPALSAQTPKRAPVERRFAADSFWIAVWQRGYSKEPDLTVEPRELLVSGDKLLVLDAATREVLVLEAATGKLLRRLEAKGRGPGEFSRPTAITPLRDGFAVFDAAEQRVSGLSFEGKLLWDIAAPSPSAVVCAQTPSRTVFKLGGAKNALVMFDTAGRQLAKWSLPWPHAEHEQLSTSAVVAGPTAYGHCIFARRYGSEFVVLSPTGKQTSHRYIEPLAEPVVDVKRRTMEKSRRASTVQETQTAVGDASALRAMVVFDTLLVLYAGSTEFKYRMIDYYHLPSGRYVHSRKLRAPAVSLAVAPSGLFMVGEILSENAGFFALRPSSTPSPKNAAR